METRKHIEQDGPFAGLWVRTARALKRAGYLSKDHMRADLESGTLRPYLSGVKDYGRYAHEETTLLVSAPKSPVSTYEGAAVYRARAARQLRVQLELRRRGDR